MKILIVEDDENSLFLHRKFINLITKSKAEVFTAVNGAIGLEIFRNNQDIDLIVSDNEMPNMNGVEMMHFIKQLKLGVKNICITSNTNKDVYCKFEAVLQKPVHISDLRKLFETYLKDLQLG